MGRLMFKESLKITQSSWNVFPGFKSQLCLPPDLMISPISQRTVLSDLSIYEIRINLSTPRKSLTEEVEPRQGGVRENTEEFSRPSAKPWNCESLFRG